MKSRSWCSRVRQTSCCRLWVAMMAVLLSLSSPLWAGIGFQPVSQDELKMTAEPKAPGAAAVILYRQEDVYDTLGEFSEEHYLRIKVLSTEGLSRANIEIPYVPVKGQEVLNITARSIRPDGTVLNFDGPPHQVELLRARAERVMAKVIALPDVRVGSVIEYSYTLRFPYERMMSARWVISSDLYTRRANFSLHPYLHSTRPLALRWTWQGLASGPTRQSDFTVAMTVVDIPAFEREEQMPPEDEFKLRVDFIYSFDNERDEQKFWQKLSAREFQWVENFTEKRKATSQAVAGLVGPGDTPEEKARKLYAAVQKLRNVSYAQEKTWQEQRRSKEKGIRTIDDVWKQGYGNGFDLNALFYTMARVAGLDASLLLLSDRANGNFDPANMNAGPLDDQVVLLRFGERKVFCDPGTPFLPYGLLDWHESGTEALVLSREKGEWLETPVTPSENTEVRHTARLKLDPEDGQLEGTVTTTYTGILAARWRRQQQWKDVAEHKRALEEEMRQQVPISAEVELTNLPDWNSTSDRLTAEFRVRIPSWGQRAGRRLLLAPGIFSAEEKHFFGLETRHYPVWYPFPEARVDDIVVELPEGWMATALPPEVHQNQKVSAYASEVRAEEKTLHVRRRLAVDMDRVSPGSYSAWRSFYNTVRTTDEEQIVVQPGAGH